MKKIKINNFEEVLYYEKLKNGLDVYLFPSKNKNIYVASYAAKYGGRNTNFIANGEEYEVPLGTAHFLEHKVFEQETGDSPLKFFAKNGSNANAMTSEKLTKYFFTCCDNFISNLRYLIEYVSNIYLTEDNVNKERAIISEEIRMYNDEADCVLYDTILTNTFLNDSVRNSVGGRIEDVMNITKEDLELCYHTFYQPSNMMLVVGGPIDIKDTFEVIKEEFDKKEFKKTNFQPILKSDLDDETKEYQEIIMDTVNPKFAFSIKLKREVLNNFSKYEIDYYIPMLFSMCFGGSSDFYERATKEKLVYYFRTFYFLGEKHIALVFMGESSKPQKFIDELRKELLNLKIDRISFERIKKAWIASEIRMIDSVYSMISNITYDLSEFGEYKNNKINDIRSLSYDKMISIIKNISIDHTSTLLIVPEKKNNI